MFDPKTSSLLTTIGLIAAIQLALPAAALAGKSVPDAINETNDIAIEAYMYLYPLVTMEITRQVLTNIPEHDGSNKAPMNRWAHNRSYVTAGFKAVVRPNFDTLYSTLWYDISKEPLILGVPEIKDRYFIFPVMDMWTDVFATLGSRTTGTAAEHYALVRPEWKGALPDGVVAIECPTSSGWIIGRIQTNGPTDYAAVHRIQDALTAVPLSRWGKPAFASEPPPFDATVDMQTPPLIQVNRMTGAEFFTTADRLIRRHLPHITDQPILARMRRIGLAGDSPFSIERLPSQIKTAIDAAPGRALAEMKRTQRTVAPVVNGWMMSTQTMGVYGTDFRKRAVIAMVGLGALPPTEAIYPVNLSDRNGKPLSGSVPYVLHFDKAALPPADAFWSITLYDQQGFHVDNILSRFAIGDRDALQFNQDGSLDIYIQPIHPGPEKMNNWLPSTGDGLINLTMRIYTPKRSVLNGEWVPPAVVTVN